MRGDDGYRMLRTSKIPLLLLASLRIGTYTQPSGIWDEALRCDVLLDGADERKIHLVNALCPSPIQIADTGFTAVMVFNEADLKALGDDCEILDANLGIILDTVTNFTVPGLKKV